MRNIYVHLIKCILQSQTMNWILVNLFLDKALNTKTESML